MRLIRALRAGGLVAATVFMVAGLAPTDAEELDPLVGWPPDIPDPSTDVSRSSDEPPEPVIRVGVLEQPQCPTAAVGVSMSTVVAVESRRDSTCRLSGPAPLAEVVVGGVPVLKPRPAPAHTLTLLAMAAPVAGPARLVTPIDTVLATVAPHGDGFAVVADVPVPHGAAVVQRGRLVGFVDLGSAPASGEPRGPGPR